MLLLGGRRGGVGGATNSVGVGSVAGGALVVAGAEVDGCSASAVSSGVAAEVGAADELTAVGGRSPPRCGGRLSPRASTRSPATPDGPVPDVTGDRGGHVP